jgi:tripartite-type tricarboxylate transporter receptor subunit TctC
VSNINRINNDVYAALAQADVQKQLVAQGLETVNMSPEQFNAILREDYEKWGKLIKESNIKLKLSNRMQSFLTLNCEICI